MIYSKHAVCKPVVHCTAGKVTVCPAKSNDSLLLGLWLTTYHLQADSLETGISSGSLHLTMSMAYLYLLRQAWLVLRWATVSRFNSQCRTSVSSISVYNQPATPGQLSLPSLRGR